MDNNKLDFDIDWGCEEIKELAKAVLPEPSLLDYYNQKAQRQIYINEIIDDPCVDYAYQIIQWNKVDKDLPIEQRKKIKIFIHTDGGDTSAMNAIISSIMLSKTPVMAIGMGKIFSAGAMIFLAAKERLLLPTARVMIHKGSSGIISDVNKIIDYSKFLEKDNELSKKFILERTNITAKKYKEVEDKDWYLLPQECVELGIATGIVSDIEELF
jgi:ATP-dependent Clp protease protease subunit